MSIVLLRDGELWNMMSLFSDTVIRMSLPQGLTITDRALPRLAAQLTGADSRSDGFAVVLQPVAKQASATPGQQKCCGYYGAATGNVLLENGPRTIRVSVTVAMDDTP